jgi:hypothetical protein
MADASAGGSSFWKQRQLEIIDLITSQEDASISYLAEFPLL